MKILSFCFLMLISLWTQAATTINGTNKFAYGANAGWMDWSGDASSGAVIGEFVCAGYIYSANVGWINLGSSAPTNGVQYQNNSATDYGVNHDGLGNLRGFAYGANIGWINFESIGAPRINLTTGKLSGAIYSANVGWISLSNVFALVQTDLIQPGADTDGDGIADAWERQKFSNLTTANDTNDFDGDGVSDQNEYLADTLPDDANSKLRITALNIATGGASPTLTWDSVLTRQYRIQKTHKLTAPNWLDSGLGLIVPTGLSSTRDFSHTNAAMQFYRVQAVRPLGP